jgi:transposase-like protein
MASPSTAQTIETEVPEQSRRRRFTKEYKIAILGQADRCSRPGEVGALLRREGLYSSHLTSWRAQRHEGSLQALERKRGPKPKRTPELVEVEKLRRENEHLREKLRKAQKIIDVQKKLSEVLGLTIDDTEENT